MWQGILIGGSGRLGFFLEELRESLKLKSLLDEAYILVTKLGFDYPSVRRLNRMERSYYIESWFREKEAEAKALEQ